MIDKYWPGPLTVVVPSYEEGQTIGIRMPDNIIALNLVQVSQRTIAAPSANFESNSPPSTCEDALKDLDGLVDIAIDGGPARFGVGSSVVDFTMEHPKVLREGVIKQKDVDEVTKKKTVLFVCTGNSCRSVMGEYMMKKHLNDRDDVEVISAGTGVFIRARASAETIKVLEEEGLDATDHEATPIDSVLLKKSDLVLVMTRGHRRQVLDRVPEIEKRVYLLKEFANIPRGSETDLDIPDPIGKSHAEYEECFLTIKEAIAKIEKLI